MPIAWRYPISVCVGGGALSNLMVLPIKPRDLFFSWKFLILQQVLAAIRVYPQLQRWGVCGPEI